MILVTEHEYERLQQQRHLLNQLLTNTLLRMQEHGRKVENIYLPKDQQLILSKNTSKYKRQMDMARRTQINFWKLYLGGGAEKLPGV